MDSSLEFELGREVEYEGFGQQQEPVLHFESPIDLQDFVEEQYPADSVLLQQRLHMRFCRPAFVIWKSESNVCYK